MSLISVPIVVATVTLVLASNPPPWAVWNTLSLNIFSKITHFSFMGVLVPCCSALLLVCVLSGVTTSSAFLQSTVIVNTVRRGVELCSGRVAITHVRTTISVCCTNTPTLLSMLLLLYPLRVRALCAFCADRRRLPGRPLLRLQGLQAHIGGARCQRIDLTRRRLETSRSRTVELVVESTAVQHDR